jgi:hypothetical protein
MKLFRVEKLTYFFLVKKITNKKGKKFSNIFYKLVVLLDVEPERAETCQKLEPEPEKIFTNPQHCQKATCRVCSPFSLVLFDICSFCRRIKRRVHPVERAHIQF